MKQSRYYWQLKTGITNHWRVQKLSDSAFRLWIIFLDFAAEMDMNGELSAPDGTTISETDLQIRSRFSAHKFKKYSIELFKVGLIEKCENVFSVCNYSEHQPELSSSAKRVARFREKQKRKTVTDGVTCNVTCNASATNIGNDPVTQCNAVEEKRRDKERKREKKKNPDNAPHGAFPSPVCDSENKSEAKPLPDISENPDVQLALEVCKKINKYVADSGCTQESGKPAVQEKVIRGAELTAGGKELVSRIKAIKKRGGVPGHPNLADSDIEDFFVSLVDLLAETRHWVRGTVSGGRSNLNMTTVFGRKSKWQKYCEDLLCQWEPPSRKKENKPEVKSDEDIFLEGIGGTL